MQGILVMEPEERVHGTARWCSHVAESPASPIVDDVVNVLAGGELATQAVAQVSFVGRKGLIWRNEQDTVEPVAKTASQSPASLPLPGLELVLDAIGVGRPSLFFGSVVGSLGSNTFNVRMATRSLGAAVLFPD